MTTTPTKMNKTQFKCFHCNQMIARREGSWVNWESMQVHLCPACDKATRDRPERAPDPQD